MSKKNIKCNNTKPIVSKSVTQHRKVNLLNILHHHLHLLLRCPPRWTSHPQTPSQPRRPRHRRRLRLPHPTHISARKENALESVTYTTLKNVCVERIY